MKFSKLRIQNFRSVGPEGVDVIFSTSRNVAVLVGPNGSGKSNVLAALGIVLGVYPFSRFEPEESDFHGKDTTKDLVIELHLAPPIIDHDVYRHEFQITGFRYQVSRYERGDRRGIFHHEHYCFGPDGKTLVKPVRIFRRGTQPDDGVDNTPKPLQATEHSWKIGNPFYLDGPSLERFFDRTTGWSPLGRLFQLYREDFEADHNQIALAGEGNVTARQAFSDLSQKLTKVLRTSKLDEIERALSTKVADYLGRSGSTPLNVSLALPSHKELLEEAVTLQISDHSQPVLLPVDRVGSGYKALLRLAVLETLLELQQDERGYLLLIEEPEMYLHTHLRRYFARVLRGIAGSGNQVVLTTHAPEMIDLAEPHEVIRLARTLGFSTITHQVKPTTVFDFSKAKQKVRRMGNEELVFANHVILTEGQDDQGVMRQLFDLRGIDFDVHSVSIINCDNADNIVDYVRLCSELGIDFYVVHDRDKPSEDETQRKRNEKIARSVQAANQELPSLHVYESSLEAAMGTTKQRGNLDHLLGLLEGKTYREIEATWPKLVAPIDEFVKSRGLAPMSQGGG